MKTLLTTLLVSIFISASGQKATLPFYLEELTSPQVKEALMLSAKTVIIPLGVLEKHGPHLPIGTDILESRELARRAVTREYAVVFPPYYFGQIFEAKHQPGIIAYSNKLLWDILQETCDELARNGFEKIILVNGHGGNNSFLPYFCQSQLASKKNYAVFLFTPEQSTEYNQKLNAMRKSKIPDQHAGETETSTMLTHRPDLVKLEVAGSESGEDQNRLSIPNAYTGIWWYAKFPNHYSGDAKVATKELGEFIYQNKSDQLVKMIQAVKADNKTLMLQNEYHEKAK
jgi:creatinine amidohydrolase